MDTKAILSSLRAERDRLDRAIAALEEGLETSSSASPVRGKAKAAPKKGGRRGPMTEAGRKRLSEMMKKRWAERRKKAKTA